MARDAKIYALGDEALRAMVDHSSGSSGGSSGTGGSGVEGRLAKVEAAIEHIQKDVSEIKADIRDLRRDASNDFRILFGALIVVALGITGLMAKGFHWL
jgi:hypothetical protein